LKFIGNGYAKRQPRGASRLRQKRSETLPQVNCEFSVCHKNMHPLIDLSATAKPGSPICCESIQKIHFDRGTRLAL
jgi:hypothetical protein